MDAALFTAIIAGTVAIATALYSTKNNRELIRLKDHLDVNSKNRDQQLAARAELDSLREPLLNAAKDLRIRICNIRQNDFAHYLTTGNDDHRGEVALLGTLHRFATYWAIQEHIYSRVNLLRFETDPDTRDVGELVGSIARTFASDGTDGLRLIFWREEQRAVAELMIDNDQGSPPQFKGFASFRQNYREDENRERKEGLALWFSDFARDLKSKEVSKSRRLEELQDKLSRLIQELEKGRAGAESNISGGSSL